MNKLIFVLLVMLVSNNNGQDNLSRPSIMGVAHMSFYVSDINKALDFYDNYLGFSKLKLSDKSSGSAIIKINDFQYIRLTECGAGSDGMLNNVGYYTDDLESMRKYLSAKNVTDIGEILKSDDGNLIFETTDPDGHKIQFIQYEPESITSKSKNIDMPESRIAIRIEHIGMTTTDEDRAEKFYTEVLGFESGNKLRVPEGNERIEFGMYRKPPTPEFRGSRNHICLISNPKVEEAISILENRNSEIKIESHLLKGKNWHANVYDPDGTRVELVDEK